MSPANASPPLALIVDDEPDIRELLEMTLKRMAVNTLSAENITEAKALLSAHTINLCLSDMRLPDGNGIDLVRHIQQNYPSIPVAMITAHGNMDLAIKALKAGAYDFVSKPVELQVLRDLIQTALKLSHEKTDEQAPAQHRLLGDSEAMQRIRQTIDKLARSQAPVYISGESGTGKELVARLIHEKGPRAEAPFVPVNCGAIPEELMESEFFGHKKGSFTGATQDKDGLFQAAHGGTLFLDEVADLPLHMQVKLLRAIQEKAIRPIGAQKEVHVDVRILSATHKDLNALIKEGVFREDLFYRINVIELQVPPLRGRPEDISLLTGYFLDRLADQLHLPAPMLSDDAMHKLRRYPFPGNIRELENILERAVTLCEGDVISADDLQLSTQPGTAPGTDETTERDGLPLETYLQQVEREAILQALAQNDNNKTAAASQLGVSFRTLRYRIKKLGIE